MLKKNEILTPLHYQLSEKLQMEINSGKYKQGDFFATEKSLIERFKVSSTTVRRVLQDFVRRGYLYRKVGQGTFVRRLQIEESLGPLSTFFEEMEAHKLSPSSDLLAVEVRKADPHIAGKLQIQESDPVYWIKKLLRANGEPIAVFESYWLYEIGALLTRFDLRTRSTFEIVENEIGIRLGEAEATIEAGAADNDEAALLRIPKGAPVLILTRIVYTQDGRPIDLGRFAYRGDRYKYRASMIRHPLKQIGKIS